MSFSIKSSHKFINPRPVEQPIANKLFDENLPISVTNSPIIIMNSSIKTNTTPQIGIKGGLSISTTDTSAEDFY